LQEEPGFKLVLPGRPVVEQLLWDRDGFSKSAKDLFQIFLDWLVQTQPLDELPQFDECVT
jgi:hypothetical protein